MLPVGLRLAAHHDQLAVVQQHLDLLAGLTVAEGKLAGGPEAHRGNHRLRSQLCLVVAVPGHALSAVVVAVQQAGIEGGPHPDTHLVAQRLQGRGPEACPMVDA